MLVLTRKKDEQIRIGQDIIITVIRVKGKSVRLGIQAPRTEPVLRGELEFREPVESSADGRPSRLTVDALAGLSEASNRLRMRPLRDFLNTSQTHGRRD